MGKIWRGWKWTILGGVAILLLALGLRLYHLTLLPVFADEAIYIRWAQIMVNESTLRFLPLSDGKQPLFMWSMMPFLKLFSDPLFAGRLASVLAGMATLAGIFLATYSLFKSQKAALVATFLYAFSPLTLFFDRMALVDSMLAMFGIWTFFLGVVTAKTQRLDLAMLTGFVLGGALLTKSPALYFAILLPTTWLFSKRPFNLIKLTALFLVTYIIAFAMYNILRLGPNFHLIAARNQDYVYPYVHIFASPFDPLFGHLGGIFSYCLIMVPFGLFVLGLIGLFTNIRNYLKETLVLSLWIVLPILTIAEYSKVVTARYILFILPFFIVLAASALLAKSDSLKKIVFAMLLVFVVQSLYTDWKFLTNVETAPLPQGERSGYLEEWTAGTGIKEAADFIKSQHRADPKTKIVIGTEGYFGTLPNGLEMYLQGIDNVVIIGVGLPISDVPQSLKESKAAQNKTYLLVNSSRFLGNADELGLVLVAAYPKALRKVDSREYNLYGPRETLLLFEVTRAKI